MGWRLIHSLFLFTEPMLIWPKSLPPPTGPRGELYSWGGAGGPLAQFLDDFGPVLLEKYKPRGIVVFSAHWESGGQCLGDYMSTYAHMRSGNPPLMRWLDTQ
jgi:aromatic ring-opening dioxygenase catalytic subunit (LigB family)